MSEELKQCIAREEQKQRENHIFLSEFDCLDLNALTSDDIELNKEEVEMEIEALESILMQDFTVETDSPTQISVPTESGAIQLSIISTVSMKVFPEESIPGQLTKILSKNSNDLNLCHNEEIKQSQDVKIRITKVEYLPAFELKVLFPVSYPSLTPPIFVLQNYEFYKGCEKFVKEKFSGIFEKGVTCVYESHNYLQHGFMADYSEEMKLHTLRYTVTSQEDYDNIKNRIKDTFNYKFAKEQKCCLICYENYYGNSFFVLSKCNHYFCENCTRMYCESLINDGKVANLTCPDTTCKKFIAYKDIQEVVSKNSWVKYEKFKKSNEVALDKETTW